MLKYDIMNIIFVSFRARGRKEQEVSTAGDTVNITVPSDLVLRPLPERAILQVQIRPVPYTRQDSGRPTSRPNSGRSSRPTFRPNSGRGRSISPFTEIPTRMDLQEEEVIAIYDSYSDRDSVPPEPIYEPGSPRPETIGPREEEPEEPRPGPP